MTDSIGKLLFFHFQVTNSKLKNKKCYFELLVRRMKNQNLDFEVAQNFLIEMIYTFRITWKKCSHIKCCYRYSSCSQQILFRVMRLLNTCTALCYCVFWKKFLLLACFAVREYAVFIWILEFKFLMQVHWYKYLQDYRRRVSSCKPNEG